MKSLALFVAAALAYSAALAGPEKIVPVRLPEGRALPDARPAGQQAVPRALCARRSGRGGAQGAADPVRRRADASAVERGAGRERQPDQGRERPLHQEGHHRAYRDGEARGWGADYPADWPRNGEWEYAAFTADGRPEREGERQQQGLLHLPPAARQAGLRDLARQAERHLPRRRGQTAWRKARRATSTSPRSPSCRRRSARAAGKPLTFFNSDDTPHQISVTNGPGAPCSCAGRRPRSRSTSRASTTTSAGCTLDEGRDRGQVSEFQSRWMTMRA